MKVEEFMTYSVLITSSGQLQGQGKLAKHKYRIYKLPCSVEFIHSVNFTAGIQNIYNCILIDIKNCLFIAVSASLQELIDAINILEEAASYINTSSSSIFDITLNGVTYSSDHSTLSLTANLTCPVGETAVDGVCGGYCIRKE